MKNKHLPVGRKLRKLSAVMLMLVFSLLWASSAKSQMSPLSTNLVTFNFLPGGGASSNAPESGTARGSTYRTGLSGATLDTILLSHVTGVTAGGTTAATPGMTYNTLTAGDNCVRLQPYYGTASSPLSTEIYTPVFLQTSVVLPAGQIFDANSSIQLEVISATSLGTASNTISKGYQIYYTYLPSSTSLVTSANDTISTNPSANTVGYTGNSYDLYANGKSATTCTTSAFQILNECQKNASTTLTTLSGFGTNNDNVVSIPGPGNSTSGVLVIQIRVWGIGATAIANNWRLAYLSLSTATAPHQAIPTINYFYPASGTLYAGAATQNLTIYGTNFIPSGGSATTVTFDGTTKTFNYLTDTTGYISVSSSDLTLGSHSIVVTNTGITPTATASYSVIADPVVAISDNGTPTTSGTAAQSSSKNLVQAFAVNNTINRAVLTSLKVHLAGTYTANDIQYIRVYYSTSNNLSTATLVGSVSSATANASSSTSGSEATPITINADTLVVGTNNYFWVVVNPSAGANIASPYSTIYATALSSSDFTFQTTTISSCSVNAGSTSDYLQIVQGQTVYMDDISNQPSGTITQNAQNVVLAGFYINPYASTGLTAINVYASGSATSTDLTGMSIYKDVNNNGTYEAGTDVLVSTNTPTFTTSNSSPMAFTLSQTVASKTQYLIVANVADVLVSTVNHNVSVSINDGDFTVSNGGLYPAVGGFNSANFLTIAAPAGAATVTTTSSAATISSIANSTAVGVWSFNIAGASSSLTSAPTKISQIKITQGVGNTITDWTQVLSSVVLVDQNGNSVTGTVASQNITFSSISTTSSSSEGWVAAGTTKGYTLKVILKSSVGSTVQPVAGKLFDFLLDSANFTTTGYQFASTTRDSSGASNEVVNVVATQLAFAHTPSSENVNTTLAPAVTVVATDANGNVSNTFSSTVTLTSSPSGVTGTLTGTPNVGDTTYFSTLSFPTAGTYSLTATASGVTSATTANFVISNGLYFGNSSGSAWEGTNNWGTTSSASPTVSWTDGNDAVFNGTGKSVTVGSSHSMTSINFATTGYTLAGAGLLTLSGNSPTVNITTLATINAPLAATGRVLFNPTTTTATLNLGATTGNNYTGSFSNGAILANGLETINLFASNPFGSSATDSLFVNSSATYPTIITTSGAGAVTTLMPLVVPNNIVIGNGGALSCGPTGASLYGNLIKYTGNISGNASAICFSNSISANGLFGTSGKGMIYFGGKNTYSGTTYVSGNQSSLICGGGDNTIPYTTDVLFFTGATAGDAPLLDLNGSNEKVASISGTDGANTHVTTGLYPGGIYNSLTYTQNYQATTTTVTVFDSLISSYITAGTIATGKKIFGSGIPYGTTISSITKQTINGYTCDVLGMSQTIASTLSGNVGFYVFFENPTQKTLTIEGVSNTGSQYDLTPSHTIDRTNANFGGIIYGNIALTLTSNNNATNKLTLLNTNTYYGPTTISSGTLKLAHVGGNTIPTTDSVIINGGTLEIATTQTLSNVNLSSGTLLVDAGDTLTITGYFTNTGGTVTNNGTIIYSGSNPFTVSAATINNNGKLNVTAANLVIAGGTLITAATDSVTVTNNTINVTSGSFTNNGGLKATSNVTLSATGTFTQNANQTLNNVNVSASTVTLGIGNGVTLTINGTLTYVGTNSIANSGTIAYGPSGALTYGSATSAFQINNGYEFVAPNLPATLTIPAGDTLKLDQDYTFPGNLVNNGVITSTSSTTTHDFTFTGTTQTISGNGTMDVLEISKAGGTVTNNGTINIIKKLILTSGTLVTNNNITLKSTSIANSAVVDVVGSGVVSGNVIVERYIPNGYRAYRDMAPEVYNATYTTGSIFGNWQENGSFTNNGYGIFITGPSAYDPSKTYLNTPTLNSTTGLDYSINGINSAWIFNNLSGSFGGAINNTKTTNLDAFQGYRVLIRGDRSFNLESTPIYQYTKGQLMYNATTLRAKGQLVTGTVTYGTTGVTGTANGASVTSSSTINGVSGKFSLVANPYVAPVLWGIPSSHASGTSVYGSSASINATFWFLDPTYNATGSYDAYNALSGSVYNDGSQSSGYIQAGQAIFVQTSGSNPTVVFNEAAKQVSSTRLSVFGVSDLSKIYVSLWKQSGGNSYNRVDGVAAAFSSRFGNDKYGPQDAYKFGGSSDILSINDKGVALSIDGRLPATATDVLPFTLAKLSGTAYEFQIDASSYSGYTAFLKDNLKGTTTELSQGLNTIEFTVDTTAASFANRFSIIFNPSALAVNSIVASATLNNKVATITWNTVGEKGESRFEVEKSADGKNFTSIGQQAAKNTSTASYTAIDNSVVSGNNFYRIKAVSETGSVSHSNVAVVKEGVEGTKYALYPNPLKGSTLNVQLSNVAAGKYVVSIYNVIGQKVNEQTISHAGGNGSHAISISNTLAGGVYSVAIHEASSKQLVYQTNLSVQP